MATLSIANSMVPGTRTTYQSIFNPGENGPGVWQFQPEREPGYSKAFFPADQQTTNYYHLNEGHNSVKNGMFQQLTGAEPTYGHVDYERNPLAQEQTNHAVTDMTKITRVQWSNSAAKSMRATPSQYPNNRGRPDYYNFSASPYYGVR